MKNNQTDDTFSTRGPLLVMILSLSIIFMALVSSYYRYQTTISDYQWVNHTTQVMRATSELKNVLMETSIRTYLVTGDKRFMVDLEKGFKNSLAQLQLVDSLTADNAVQQKRCDSIKILVEERYALMVALVKAKESGDDSLLFKEAIHGRDLMDSIIATINLMSAEESRLLNIRVEVAERGSKTSPVFLLFASAISFFFIVLIYQMLARAYKKSLALQNLLAQNIKDLNRSNSELEQFAYIASHDLQEPLRKLRTFGNMIQIKEKDRLSEEGKELFERMQTFGARMQHLIEDLLMFSRLLNKEKEAIPVDLNKIIADIKSSVPDMKKGKEISIQSDTLPVVNGYESQLHQLFQNLISNSIKYSKADEKVKINITFETVSGSLITNALDKDRQSLFYKISVNDNGIGFDNEYSEKIFNIFQRLHGKSEYEGTGIGLAICKRVVENHTGYISANGQPGVGAVINIYLPKNGSV